MSRSLLVLKCLQPEMWGCWDHCRRYPLCSAYSTMSLCGDCRVHFAKASHFLWFEWCPIMYKASSWHQNNLLTNWTFLIHNTEAQFLIQSLVKESLTWEQVIALLSEIQKITDFFTNKYVSYIHMKSVWSMHIEWERSMMKSRVHIRMYQLLFTIAAPKVMLPIHYWPQCQWQMVAVRQ